MKIVDKVIDRALDKLGPDVTKEDLEEMGHKLVNDILTTGLLIVGVHALCKAALQFLPQKHNVVLYLDDSNVIQWEELK
jgi:hypothetical protein